MIYLLPVGSGKKRFSKCLIFRKTAFFFEHCVSVNQQSQCTIRNLISKLAPNWLTNVKVIDLTFFGTDNWPSVNGGLIGGPTYLLII